MTTIVTPSEHCLGVTSLPCRKSNPCFKFYFQNTMENHILFVKDRLCTSNTIQGFTVICIFIKIIIIELAIAFMAYNIFILKKSMTSSRVLGLSSIPADSLLPGMNSATTTPIANIPAIMAHAVA